MMGYTIKKIGYVVLLLTFSVLLVLKYFINSVAKVHKGQTLYKIIYNGYIGIIIWKNCWDMYRISLCFTIIC